MNINDFQNLSREAQFTEAGRIAGIEPSVFDGLWRTESGRGANMLSPKGAEGHFQIMPKTRKTMEGRFGAAIDPYNFGDSLFTAAHLLKENMGKFKNVPDALRAYNGGWDKTQWGNSETSAYAGLVLGSDDAPSTLHARGMTAPDETAFAGRMGADAIWDNAVPFGKATKPPKGQFKVDKVAQAAASSLVARSPVPTTSDAIFGAVTTDAAEVTAADDKLKADTGPLTMARAAAFYEPFNAMARHILRDDEPVDPAYVPDEAMMKDKPVGIQRDLRSATSLKQANRMLFDYEYGKDADSLAFKHGTMWGLGATLIAELPAAALTGFATSAAFSAAGVGATALAAQGRKGAAIASSFAEGVIGNVAYTAALDMAGERQGLTAYGIAVAGGALNPILMGRGLGSAADAAEAAADTARRVTEIAAQEAALMAKAATRLPADATPAELRAVMNEIEAEGVRADKAVHAAPIPESRMMPVGEVADAPISAADEAAETAVLDAAIARVTGKEPVVVRTVEPIDELRIHDAEVAAAKATPAEPAPVAPTPVEAVKEALAPIPEAAPIVAAIEKAAPTPKAEPAPVAAEAPAAPMLPLEEVVPKAAPKARAPKEPKLGKTPGQGELYPLTPSDKKALAAARAKANEEAMVEVPAGKMDGQGELDFSAPKVEPAPKTLAAEWDAMTPVDRLGVADNLHPDDAYGVGQHHRKAWAELPEDFKAMLERSSKELAEVNAINGRSVVEVAEWAVANTPPELAVIAQRALAQLRSLATHGLIVGKVEVTAPGMRLRGTRGVTTMENPKGIGNGPSTVGIKLNHPSNGEQSGVRAETIVHELFHAATMASIQLGKKMAAKGTVLAKVVDDLHAVHADLIKFFNARVKSGAELSDFEKSVFNRNNNAMADVDESLTWALTNKDMQNYLDAIPYKKGSLWTEFVKGVRSLLGMSPSQDTMLSEYLRIGERLTAMDSAELKDVTMQTGKHFSTNNGFGPEAPEKLAADVRAMMTDPVAIRNGLDRLPMATPAERAEAKQMIELYRKAESPAYVVDEKRLSWLLKHAPSFSPTSNIMLRSKNPVVRMAALELLENGGGAGGRRSTAAIAKHLNERAIIGNAIVDIDAHFNRWFKTSGWFSHLREAMTGTQRARFHRLIAEEIEQRRPGRVRNDLGQPVRDAADAAQNSFERSSIMQVEAKVVGWAALPDTSVGYMPRRIKSTTYRQLTVPQKRALHSELTDQFIMNSQFDPSFSDQLASRYLDRVAQRALGGFDSPMGLHQTGAADIVEDALKSMGLTRPEIDAAMKRYAKGGAGHTKKRLDLDLSKEIMLDDGTSFRLMDVYDTDILSLLRSQSQRVAGEVALARHGVMGRPGLAIMRRAMGYGATGQDAIKLETDAFDQVASEFLGSPFGVSNKWVDRAVQLNSVLSLGGMGFNQLAEIINVGLTLGLKAAIQNVTGFGRLRSEILSMAKGKQVYNPWLHSIEQFGGAEFGTDAYKMVFPMDNPDLFANSLGADSIHAGDRLLRGAGHLQSKLSLWRIIHAVQVRGVAEQIVLKASRALKSGANDFHLRDMGIDDDVLARLRVDMPNIAQYSNGKLVAFDITKATDKDAANAFVQGVHRGASQIIQGTFIGESGKYVHNSWLRMMTQFRSFSLTAIDKQFNRQLGNRGAMGTMMLTMGAMSVAAPLYWARTYAASVGRADQAEYLEKHMSFGATVRATTNYIATAGLGGDLLDTLTAVTGTGEYTGGRSGTNSQLIGNMVAPVAGKIDKLWGTVQNTKDENNAKNNDWAALAKEWMPGARLPFIIPAFNALGK